MEESGKIRVENFSIVLSGETQGKIFFEATISHELDEIAKKAKRVAIERAKEKFGNIRITSNYVSFTVHPKPKELCALVRMCIGDGDYIDRCVFFPLPELEWA